MFHKFHCKVQLKCFNIGEQSREASNLFIDVVVQILTKLQFLVHLQDQGLSQPVSPSTGSIIVVSSCEDADDMWKT